MAAVNGGRPDRTGSGLALGLRNLCHRSHCSRLPWPANHMKAGMRAGLKLALMFKHHLPCRCQLCASIRRSCRRQLAHPSKHLNGRQKQLQDEGWMLRKCIVSAHRHRARSGRSSHAVLVSPDPRARSRSSKCAAVCWIETPARCIGGTAYTEKPPEYCEQCCSY